MLPNYVNEIKTMSFKNDSVKKSGGNGAFGHVVGEGFENTDSRTVEPLPHAILDFATLTWLKDG